MVIDLQTKVPATSGRASLRALVPLLVPILALVLMAACEDGVDTPARSDTDEPADTGPVASDGDTQGEETGTEDTADDVATDAKDTDDGSRDSKEPDGDAEPPCPGCFLDRCESNGGCISEFCVDSAEGPVCSKTCGAGESCPQGWSCTQASSGGDPTFICLPNDARLCRPCHSDEDCNDADVGTDVGVCFDAGTEGSFCTRRCESDAACVEGFSCQSGQPYGEDGPVIDICQPDDSEEEACQCSPKYVGDMEATSSCYRENEHGTCHGEARCAEVGELPECDAPEPAEETCNGVDDDCDGETDEDAANCTMYYQDPDGDGYGHGSGSCLCEDPGQGWVEQGGDCNELVTGINPGADEACTGLDEDCDGKTDEAGAIGCTIHYLDEDGDGFGQDGVTDCFCKGKEGWSPDGGDCNDLNPNVYPGADEWCDGIDNDCDGKTDEAGAVDCKPFFLDQDGDGYGVTESVRCLCGPTGAFLASKPGDCDDSTTSVNPGVPELCNGIDDDCDGETDEGDPGSMCPQVANGSSACVEGVCSLVDCDDGWSDADGDPLNGCECPAGDLEQGGGLGNSCSSPVLLGEISDVGGTPLEVTDNIAPVGDVDWYAFTAIDGADPNGCDTFDLRVFFLHNPQGQFTFDVFRGGCAGSQEICHEVTEHSYSTNLNSIVDGERIGECPCTNDPATTTAEVNECSDQTSSYFVKVYRKPGFDSTCAAYTLRITNGM